MAGLTRGTRIDRYQVEDRIGSGGMAIVYRVRHVQLGTAHALKVLEVPARAVQQRLLQEGRVQASLRHPNIVAVTDVISIGGAPGLVMELINGPSLDQLLRTYPLTLEQADAIALQILDGVQAAHEHGVVHRDLKPANVMIEVQRSGLVAKVADFGLVKVLNDDALNEVATRSGATMGTPCYMSPEQIRDAKHVDHRTDVFSLGCILYDLVCGRRAFVGKDTLDIFRAVDESRYVPPLEVRPDLPRRMHDAIVGALQADLEARTPDCAALRRAWLGEHLSSPAAPLAVEDPAWPSPLIDQIRAMGSSGDPSTGIASLAAPSREGQTFAGVDFAPRPEPRGGASTLVVPSGADSGAGSGLATGAAAGGSPARGGLNRPALTIGVGAIALAALLLLAVWAGAFLGGGSGESGLGEYKTAESGAGSSSAATAEGVEIAGGGATESAGGEGVELAGGGATESAGGEGIGTAGGGGSESAGGEGIGTAGGGADVARREGGQRPDTAVKGSRSTTPRDGQGEARTSPTASAPATSPDASAPPTQTSPDRGSGPLVLESAAVGSTQPARGRVRLDVSGPASLAVSLFQNSEPTGQLGGQTGREIEVVPGEHTVYCTFGSDAPTQCAVLTVAAGQVRRLRCDTGLRNCKVF